MDILELAKGIMPAGPIVIVFFLTWAVMKYFTQPDASGVAQKAPKWFILFPLGLGFIVGLVYYFYTTDTAALVALSFGRKAINAFWQGLLFGAGAIAAWEFYKNIFQKKIEGPQP